MDAAGFCYEADGASSGEGRKVGCLDDKFRTRRGFAMHQRVFAQIFHQIRGCCDEWLFASGWY
ncbi:MAG: Uncharacterised protein [SAR116 cluster bacterium MED-G04]|nr:MAG: Uncharacterised protein [SAR116 cluster bacterium MED-G04]